MPKISNRPLTQLTRIRIWADTAEYLHTLFDNTELGFAGAIREILETYVREVRARAEQSIDRIATPINLDDLNARLDRAEMDEIYEAIEMEQLRKDLESGDVE